MAARIKSEATKKREATLTAHVPDPLRSAIGRANAAKRYATPEDLPKREAEAVEKSRPGLSVQTRIQTLIERESEATGKAFKDARPWLAKFQKRQTVACLAALGLAAENAVLAVRTALKLMTDDKQTGMVRLLAAKMVCEWAQMDKAAELLNRNPDELSAEEIQAQIEADRKVLIAMQSGPNEYQVAEATEILSEMPTD